MVLLMAGLVGAAGLGGVVYGMKNSSKVSAIAAELSKLEAAAVSDAKAVIAAVRSHL